MSCPCGRSSPYEACCGVHHAGAEPTDAETLMRSRYSAFVKKDIRYLHRTLHPSHDDGTVPFETFEVGMKRHFASGVVYRGLTIVATADEDEDGVSKVLFIARLAQRNKDRSFAEVSSFARVHGAIRYLTGVTISAADASSLPEADAIAEAERRASARRR